MQTVYKCHCDNGWNDVEEHGRLIRDACYHCGNTGWISEETYENDRIEAVAEVLAGIDVDRQKRVQNSNPDGEGWAFCAAEHGCSEYEYSQGAFYAAVGTIMDELKTLKETCPRVLRNLLDMHAPDDRDYKCRDQNGKEWTREQIERGEHYEEIPY